MDPLTNYLLRRADRPIAWVVVFVSLGALCGAVSGWQQGGIEGACCLIVVGGIVGAIVGARAGMISLTLCRVVGWLNRRAAGLEADPLRQPWVETSGTLGKEPDWDSQPKRGAESR